jgi:hypothetical protein
MLLLRLLLLLAASCRAVLPLVPAAPPPSLLPLLPLLLVSAMLGAKKAPSCASPWGASGGGAATSITLVLDAACSALARTTWMSMGIMPW